MNARDRGGRPKALALLTILVLVALGAASCGSDQHPTSTSSTIGSGGSSGYVYDFAVHAPTSTFRLGSGGPGLPLDPRTLRIHVGQRFSLVTVSGAKLPTSNSPSVVARVSVDKDTAVFRAESTGTALLSTASGGICPPPGQGSLTPLTTGTKALTCPVLRVAVSRSR